MIMGSVIQLLSQRVVPLASAFLFSVSMYMLPLFTFIATFIFRAESLVEKNGEEMNFVEAETEPAPEFIEQRYVNEFIGFDSDAGEEKEGVFLKFKFPSFEEFSRIHEKQENIANSEVSSSLSTCKYEFASGEKSVSAFIDKQDYNEIPVLDGEGNDNTEAKESVEISEEKVHSGEDDDPFEGTKDFLDEPHSLSETNSISFKGSYGDSNNIEEIHSVTTSSADADGDGFLSDGDFGLQSMQESSKDFHAREEEMDTTTEKHIKVAEYNDFENPDELESDFLSAEDFKGAGFLTNYEKTESDDSTSADSANKLESLWQHQDLIDQLKVELRKMRDNGLPTILEESESPKIMEDLKPWKMDEKFQLEDGMGKLHKFYKSYRERMRKFDILNFQKMYAMGLLQLKDPLKSTENKKPTAPSLRTLVSQNLWLSKHRTHGSDPTKKFINEVEGDLEVVYVGQMCVSWEMLFWQYEKALDLWDSDPRGVCSYNEVAGEFQQFQVLLQRFVEDEPFHGPRVQNYVKNRCVLRNLLQVPVIRADNMKDKKWRAWKKDRDEYVVTSETLVEIMEESIRIFWRFVKADKDCNVTQPINAHRKIVPELYDPEDLSLLLAATKSLQKKERKLKDSLRSENCILRRFRRLRDNGEDDWDQVLSFFSQLDMRLVCRVLRMPKITRDHLIWCHDKLDRISFVNRKMSVEPGFLLFPC